MFAKTSSIPFLKFGDVYTEMPAAYNEQGPMVSYEMTLSSDPFNTLYKADHQMYISVSDGFAMLLITEDLSHPLEEFVIHRIVEVHKGMYFNMTAISPEARIKIEFPASTTFNMQFLSESRRHTRLQRALEIDELLAYFYNVRGSNYHFSETRQQCWELTYVDAGTLNTRINGVDYQMEANTLVFYEPGDLVTQSTMDNSCSYLTIMFSGIIPEEAASRLHAKVIKTSPEVRKDLELFVHQAKHPYTHSLLINALEHILLTLLSSTSRNAQMVSSPMQENFENELLNEILLYIYENVYTALNVEDLCSHFAMSRSTLQNLFTTHLGVAPKQFISTLKLKRSRVLIRENKYTISEISGMLGYSSIHYFSRKFKSAYGMTPTEYARKLVD